MATTHYFESFEGKVPQITPVVWLWVHFILGNTSFLWFPQMGGIGGMIFSALGCSVLFNGYCIYYSVKWGILLGSYRHFRAGRILFVSVAIVSAFWLYTFTVLFIH
jgi:hypothetical protein